jgi:hypothetical protein
MKNKENLNMELMYSNHHFHRKELEQPKLECWLAVVDLLQLVPHLEVTRLGPLPQ